MCRAFVQRNWPRQFAYWNHSSRRLLLRKKSLLDQTFTNDHNVNTIVDFVENVAPTWGYTYPECYELVLHEARNFAWMDGWAHVLVMIGDEIPHEKHDNPKNIDWREELNKLKEMGITIHGVQAL